VSLRITEPMERKNEKVAALLSIYCESVAIAPLGPAPPLKIVKEPKINPMERPTPAPIIAPIFIFCQIEGPCICWRGIAIAECLSRVREEEEVEFASWWREQRTR